MIDADVFALALEAALDECAPDLPPEQRAAVIAAFTKRAWLVLAAPASPDGSTLTPGMGEAVGRRLSRP